MVAIGSQSLDKVTNLFFGYWSHVSVTEDPLGAATNYYMGKVEEGSLEISREDVELLGTTFPQRTEVVVPTRAGMKFTGQVSELHKRNLHFMLGDLPSTANNYLYPGASCPDETKFVRFIARRIRCDAFVMETVFWKAQHAGLLQLGAGDPEVKSPLEVNGLDDTNGDWGGSATAPLGYLYAPDPAT